MTAATFYVGFDEFYHKSFSLNMYVLKEFQMMKTLKARYWSATTWVYMKSTWQTDITVVYCIDSFKVSGFQLFPSSRVRSWFLFRASNYCYFIPVHGKNPPFWFSSN